MGAERTPPGSTMSAPEGTVAQKYSTQSQYWSQKALWEDKKRCLAEMPHAEHTVANTLEHLHEDKKHHSCAAIAERKKLHQSMGNETWRRRPSTPTHPYASNLEVGKKYFSHAELVEAKKKHGFEQTSAREPQSARESDWARESRRVPLYGDAEGMDAPFSARSPGRNSFSRRSESDADSRQSRGPSGAQSPTIKEIVHHQGRKALEHPHNESASNWWQTVREQRDTGNPHTSFENFDIKKKHHMTDIHDTTTTKTPRSHYNSTHVALGSPQGSDDARAQMLYQRDPMACAVQGDYPQCFTNEAWGPARGDQTPPSRYHSADLFKLDKRRHATPIDGGSKKDVQNRIVDAFSGTPFLQSDTSGRDDGQANSKGNLYRSNFAMQQHKKKHIATVKSGQERGVHAQMSTLSASFSGPVGRGNPLSSATPDGKGNSGFRSQRELQYCKRFNTVALRPPQDLEATDVPDKPWPKPGQARRDTESLSSSTPPFPARSVPGEPLTATGRAHHMKAITKYSTKSGLRNSQDSSASDPNLLHSSQLELAERKAGCATAMRHSPMTATREGRMRGSASGSDVTNREPARDGGVLASQKQLEYSKTLHRFAHDDARRRRPAATPCPVPPTPRSGQWTPAHI